MTAAVSALLADTEIDPTTGKGPEWGKAAPVALLIILLMGLALYFLIRSMSKQLKRVPKSFDRSDTAVASPSSVDAAGRDDRDSDPDGSAGHPDGTATADSGAGASDSGGSGDGGGSSD